MAGKQIYAALMAVQRDLKAPKGQFNSFGKYKYRSTEDIVEAVKPLLIENGLILNMTDEVMQVANRIYIKATVSVIDVATGDTVTTSAVAREAEAKKGADESQITGAASSYARKYALNGLFAIDDTKDADTDEYHNQQSKTDEKQQALHQLNDAIKKIGASKEQLVQITQAKYKKSSTSEMSPNEIKNLATNLAKFIKELS